MSKIFSGPDSKKLWGAINSVTRVHLCDCQERIEDVLYLLGCYCQKLESKVDRLQKKLDEALRTQKT